MGRSSSQRYVAGFLEVKPQEVVDADREQFDRSIGADLCGSAGGERNPPEAGERPAADAEPFRSIVP